MKTIIKKKKSFVKDVNMLPGCCTEIFLKVEDKVN